MTSLTRSQAARRQRVVAAALDLGSKGGYDAVQMRDVATSADVALGTIYRYFSSKDHLLAAAMTEWTGRLKARVAQSPPRGSTAAAQMSDVLHRACKAMERQPKLTVALVRSLSSADPGVVESGEAMEQQIAAMGNDILEHLDPDVRADILSVLGHVWYSALISWANGRRDFTTVVEELDRACRVLIGPYEATGG
jgi:AcrR family transcriptional regulator